MPDASACASYEVRNDVDAFKGRCDLAVSGGRAPPRTARQVPENGVMPVLDPGGEPVLPQDVSAFGPLARMPGAVSGVKKS